MKRTTFALCATYITLCAMAQGKFQKRLQGNPMIDSLVSEVKALGGRAFVTYYYDRRFHKTVNIDCSLLNDFQPTPSTGDPKKDALNHVRDSFQLIQLERGNGVYNAIRNTCKSLTDIACESYIWEYHRGGVDSVRYTIAIGEYQNGDTMTTYQHQRDVQYYNAPEILTFRYNSSRDNDGSAWRHKGFGYFTYEYTPDSVGKRPEELAPFNKEAYTKLLLSILKQKGITSRQFYVYHDSTYTFAEKSFYDGDFVVRQNTLSPKQPKSETRGTVYTIHSKALADSVLSQLKRKLWIFLEENPGVGFFFHPDTYYGLNGLVELFKNYDSKRIPDIYYIYLHSLGEKEFNIVVVEGMGDLMIPMEWPILKSWKNGKVVYNKMANTITPKQARESTSANRMYITRSFDPIDEREK